MTVNEGEPSRLVGRRDPRSNIEWQYWGDVDPFWAVSSWPGRERNGAHPWSAVEFYELGRADWSDFVLRWRRYGIERGTCVELGCGAGRLTKHMADDFASVIGVDVSDGMLSVARTYIDDPRIDFRLGDGVNLPVDTASAAGVFSTHVFQHLNSLGVAKANFHEIARALATGGTAMIHLPVFLLPDWFSMGGAAIAVRRQLSDARATRRRRRGQPVMRRLEYSLSWLFAELSAVGLTDLELLIFAVKSNGDRHPFIFARKT